MLLSVALISLVMIVGSRHRALVPGRLQGVAEMAHDFVADMLEIDNRQGRPPFLPVRLLPVHVHPIRQPDRLLPLHVLGDRADHRHRRAGADRCSSRSSSSASQGARAALLQAVRAPGVPIYILPLVVAIEIISFLSRPVSHSVRLFANMLAGHITLQGVRRLRRPAAGRRLLRRRSRPYLSP